MALNIQIPYRGDAYLAQGISSAGQNLASGIESMTANLKKAKAYRTMAVDALGMDPDAVDGMSLPQLEGHFQAEALKRTQASAQAMAQEHQARMEELRAQAQERQQKMQLSSDEAEAWPQLMQSIMAGRAGSAAGGTPAPQANPDASAGGTMPEEDPSAMMGAPGGAQGTASPTSTGTPGGQFSPEEIMAGMAHMGKTSPRLAAALTRTLIPQLMQGASSGPRPWKSPEGNPYVWMGHNLVPDRAALDPSSLMGQPLPDGYSAVQTGKDRVQIVKNEKAPTVPAEFHSTMDKLGEDIASANATLQQPDGAFVDAAGKPQSPDYIKQMRGYAQKRLAIAQDRGKKTIDRYHSTGVLSDEQKESMYGELGLGAATTPAAAGAVKYKSADEVRAAVKAGTLKKEAAVEILQKQFGMK